jgi:hypothetical protein
MVIPKSGSSSPTKFLIRPDPDLILLFLSYGITYFQLVLFSADSPFKKNLLPHVPGSVFGHNKDSPPPQLRETKKKLACSTSINNNNNNSLLSTSNSSRTHNSNNSSGVKAARSVQNVSAAERSYTLSDQQQQQQSRSHAVHRTPHRTAGYGGAGQPSRGPHR